MTCKLVKHSIFKNKQRQKTVQPPLSEKRHYSVRRFIQKVKVAIIYRTMCYFSSYICVYISIKYYAYRFPSRILLNLHTEIVFFFFLSHWANPYYACLSHHHFFPEFLKYLLNLPSCVYFCLPTTYQFSAHRQSNLSNLSHIM